MELLLKECSLFVLLFGTYCFVELLKHGSLLFLLLEVFLGLLFFIIELEDKLDTLDDDSQWFLLRFFTIKRNLNQSNATISYMHGHSRLVYLIREK